MSSNENDDKDLFLYYLDHGHLPENYKKNKEESNNVVNNKKTKKNYNNSIQKEKETNLEQEKALFLEYIKNLDLSNYNKKIYPKRQTHNNLKKIKTNKIIPNDKLDLHGTKYKDAKQELDTFLKECNYKNYSCVIIIHGKGYGSEDGKSVLKSLVEDFLIENKELYKIKNYIEAPQNLGGSGAKIVFFKNNK